ncbi:hypothetical protein [Agrococcus carbonis]|nr:hypothetical protein [Agrococcus carbonis]
MIEDLLHAEPEARPSRTAPAPSPMHRRRARLGPMSLWLLLAAAVLQVIALVQQFSYLFAPRPGELALLIVITGVAVLVSLAGIACGIAGATTPGGRRTGVFGAALGIGLLVLFGAATSFGFGFLEALSTPV